MDSSFHRPPSSGAFQSFLLPKYGYLLSLGRRRPRIRRLCGNMSVLTCFAVCLCAAAYMYTTVDEIMDADQNQAAQERLEKYDISILRAILEQRGVLLDDATDINNAIQETGTVTEEEVNSVSVQNSSSSTTTSSDSLLHKELTQGELTPAFYDKLKKSGLKSLLFANELEFAELVEDSKDSVWLLAVLADQALSSQPNKRTFKSSNTGSVISHHTWGKLVHRYSAFGFKFGFLDCQRLKSICVDRGFMAADLILALPVGGDRMKDSVQFRAFKRRNFDTTDTLDGQDVLRNVHRWLVSILSMRVRRVKNAADILPASLSSHRTISNWLKLRPQPLHFIWLSNYSLCSSPCRSAPPLVLSSLSVSYTGRVHFWQLDREQLPDTSSPSRPSSSIAELLRLLRCPYQFANYLVITPEAKCHSFGDKPSEHLSHPTLELYLRTLYPSADDLLYISFLLVNAVLLIGSGFRFGRLTGLALKVRSITNRSQPYPGPSIRAALTDSIIQDVNQGWTLHPHPDSHPSFRPRSRQVSTQLNLVGRCCRVLKDLLMDITTTNLVALLAILPVINLLSMPVSSPAVNTCLWLLRLVSVSRPACVLRSAILQHHISWRLFIGIALSLWCILLCTTAYLHHCLLTYNHSRNNSYRSRRATNLPSDHLTFGSPVELSNELRRFLMTSDAGRGPRSGSSSTSTESFTDGDEDISAINELDYSNLEADERERLLRRLRILQDALREASHIDSTETERSGASFFSASSNVPNCPSMIHTHVFSWRFLPPEWSSGVQPTPSQQLSNVDVCQKINPSTSSRNLPSSSGLQPRLRSRFASQCSTSEGSAGLLVPIGASSPLSRPTSWPSWVMGTESCVICWVDYIAGVELGALPCSHAFHESCIRRWFDTGTLDCPVCRWPACFSHPKQKSQFINRLASTIQSTIDASQPSVLIN